MADQVTHIYFGASSVLTSLGDGEATLAGIRDGRCGLRYSDKYKMIAGLIDDSLIRHIDGYTRLESAVIAQITDVCSVSGVSLADPDVQLVVSTTKGNVELLEGHTEDVDPRALLYESARRVAERFGSANRPIVISNACISGVTAFVVARRLILDGRCRSVIVVGCDFLSEFITSGFASFKSVSDAPCRPYDVRRNGLTLGEACATILVTADLTLAHKPLIELEAGAVTNDANHISGPSRTGDGLFNAIDSALRQSALTPADIGFVNAHGTATVYNDEMESKALALADLSDVPLNSLKGYIGHTLGASGVVETIMCVEQLRISTVFGTLGYLASGVPCRVSVSAEHRPLAVRRCLKTASGFGGCNAAIVLADASLGDEPLALEHLSTPCVTASSSLPASSLPFGEFIRARFHAFGEPDMKFYKMSDLCKAAYVATRELLSSRDLCAEYDSRRVAVVLSNSHSSLDADLAHQRIVEQHAPEGASPAVFVYTLPNVAVGEICIKHKFRGENTFFIEPCDGTFADYYASMLVRTGIADAVVCGRCELSTEGWNVQLKLIEKNNN